jgi:hypothetical protein
MSRFSISGATLFKVLSIDVGRLKKTLLFPCRRSRLVHSAAGSEKNHWNMKRYEDASAIMVERLGSLTRVEHLLENFQFRCRLLSVELL